ncbi:uncharacterized protein [Dysidea avara]|uniref:uncharacterized protein isoform X2 n=1 Tax=Dysidea avara TaxID=196820 RepID=UPI00332B6E13
MAAGANRAYLVEGAVVIDQIENKDDKPTMIELERHGVAQQYAADWFETGVKLGLNDFPNVLENITESSLENDRLCFHEVLYKWLKLFPDATWRSLEVALTNVKREKLHLDPVTDVNISMLTSWGRNQIDSIKILLQEAWSNIQYLQKKEEACDETDSKDWLKFRSIMFDLYSVLDYTYYLYIVTLWEKESLTMLMKVGNVAFLSNLVESRLQTLLHKMEKGSF